MTSIRHRRLLLHAATLLLFVATSAAVVVLRLGSLQPGTRVHIGARARPVHCDLIAAPDGTDRGTGSPLRPFRTVDRLIEALHAGATGCLRRGVYREDVTIRHGGTARAPMVLRSYPGQRATIRGRLYLARAAAHTTIEYLNLDGRSATTACAPRRCPSPSVDADDTTFAHDDVTNAHTGICFDIGSETYGVAHDTLIIHDRIHDCGQLPATNHEHGIYLQDGRGTRIISNVIEDNADRGIQLYPHAVGTMIEGNVIADNGEGIDISGLGSVASDHNVISRNVIVDSQRGYNVASFYARGGRIGTGNIVADNCIGGGARAAEGQSMGVGEAVGFEADENISLPSGPSRRATLPSRTGAYALCVRILGGAGLTVRSGL